MSLSKSALLVELNISSWSGRKLDRKVSEETNKAKGANKDAIRANKNLFCGSDKLEKINNFVSAARQEYYTMTLPWSTSGARLLPFKEFFNFQQWVSTKEAEFDIMVDTFLTEYSSLISIQAFRLGSMFDASEYPLSSELKCKFKFGHIIIPMPEAGDFRIDAEADLKAALEEQYKAAYEERTIVAMNDLWDRLYTTVSHLRDKCAMEKTIFRESTMDNALELCSLLTRLNVTGDANLEARRQELEKALCSTSTDALRADEGVRNDVKDKMDALLAKMKGVL
jgi:hypothetical protein